MVIDLNADSGESFGPWPMGHDAALFEHLSSANLACGFHAGDPLTLARTVALAKASGIAIGAHPGFPDRVGFGRRDLAASPDEVYADTLYQLGALEAFGRPHGLELHHVKAHGALYLKMLRDAPTAAAVAAAVRDFNPALPFVVLGGPGGAVMAEAAREHGLRAVQEAFPDRAYTADGRLASRELAGATVHDPEVAAARAVQMVCEGVVSTLGGGTAEVTAQTLCIHGDAPNAPEMARAVRAALEASGVRIRAF